jgi:hypothetical protein
MELPLKRIAQLARRTANGVRHAAPRQSHPMGSWSLDNAYRPDSITFAPSPRWSMAAGLD